MSLNAEVTPTAITGLAAQEAAARLDRFGPNEPAATQHHSTLSSLLHVFRNPLVLILVTAAITSAFLGQTVDGKLVGRIHVAHGQSVPVPAEFERHVSLNPLQAVSHATAEAWNLTSFQARAGRPR